MGTELVLGEIEREEVSGNFLTKQAAKPPDKQQAVKKKRSGNQRAAGKLAARWGTQVRKKGKQIRARKKVKAGVTCENGLLQKIKGTLIRADFKRQPASNDGQKCGVRSDEKRGSKET